MTCDTYCVLADIGLATQTGGEITICNQSRVHFTSGKNKLRLDQNTLKEGWESTTRQEIRNALNNNIQHENCRDCWDEELAGRLSLRNLVNEQFKDVKASLTSPRVFMLKPGNLCNLSCRHCNPYVSSNWYRDHYQVAVKPFKDISFVDYAKQYDVIRDSYDPANEKVWSVLQDWNRDIIYYDLYGAEPLLIQPVLDLLKSSVEKGYAENQTIHVNTNGTIWRDEFNEIFSKFKKIDLGISIDATSKWQYEYMRYPADWSEVLHNITKYKLLAEKHSNISLSICITASLLNVFYLPEYITFFHTIGIDCGINFLHRPDYLNMRIAPKHAKQKIIEKLSDNNNIVWTEKQHSVINYLMLDYPNSELLLEQFFKFTNEYDYIRNQSYKHAFSEFYKILTNE